MDENYKEKERFLVFKCFVESSFIPNKASYRFNSINRLYLAFKYIVYFVITLWCFYLVVILE